MQVGFRNCLTKSIIQDSDSLLFSYLFLKTFAILPAKIRFISDHTRSIIPAGVTKIFKLQSGDINKLLFEHMNQEFSSHPYMQVGFKNCLT